MTQSFNPNDYCKEIYATHIPNRSPVFKLHEKIGHAKNALKNQSYYSEDYKTQTIPDECTLWKFIDNEWVEIPFDRTFARKEKLKLYDCTKKGS